MTELTPQQVWQAYELAEHNYDSAGRADCIAAAFAMLAEHPEWEQLEEVALLAARVKCVLLAGLDALAAGDGKSADYYLGLLAAEVLATPAYFPMQYFYKAWARYLKGDSVASARYLMRHLDRFPMDRLAQQALISIRNGASVVWINNEGLAKAITAPYDVPIFINSRDRVGGLARLVDWLLASGYRRIFILDNASTYAPLLDYYRSIERQGVRVIYLRRNIGHRALWESRILDVLDIKSPYVYTDPDILPTEVCPQDFVARLARGLAKYPYLNKIGLALRTDDITFYNAAATKSAEARCYNIPMDDSLYFADVDTTLALYRNIRHYTRGPAARIASAYSARHLPWYYDYDSLPTDEAYYLEHASYSSSLKAVQEGIVNVK